MVDCLSECLDMLPIVINDGDTSIDLHPSTNPAQIASRANLEDGTRINTDKRTSRSSSQRRPKSVVFVLEFLRFTDVRSGKAFEI